MAVDALADRRDPRATESTVEGPFWAPNSPERSFGASIAEQPGGIPLLLHGRVLDELNAAPIAGAEIDVWQNGPNRLYAVQDADAPEHHLRGRFRTRSDASYAIRSRWTWYRIPDDGPVGAMLRATARQSWRPAHIHVAVSAPGFQTVVTHIFDEASDYLNTDAVFAVKPSLVKRLRTGLAILTPSARPALKSPGARPRSSSFSIASRPRATVSRQTCSSYSLGQRSPSAISSRFPAGSCT